MRLSSLIRGAQLMHNQSDRRTRGRKRKLSGAAKVTTRVSFSRASSSHESRIKRRAAQGRTDAFANKIVGTYTWRTRLGRSWRKSGPRASDDASDTSRMDAQRNKGSKTQLETMRTDESLSIGWRLGFFTYARVAERSMHFAQAGVSEAFSAFFFCSHSSLFVFIDGWRLFYW